VKNALAITAGIIEMTSVWPYLIDVARKKTKPNIVSWITWTVLTTIASAAAFASHAPQAAILTLGATIATLLVVVLGLRYGMAKLTVFDLVCQIAAIAGFILWLIFNRPSIALIFSLSIDITVTLPTLRHAWLEPGEETWQTYAVGLLASILTLLALSKYSFADLAFPVWFITFGCLIVPIIIFRRIAKGLQLAR
jgi:hypothetical protein